MKKLPTELTTEELLNLLDKEVETKKTRTTFKDKVTMFISQYNIKPGTNKVLSKQLFKLFKHHNPESTLSDFATKMCKLIPSERGSRNNTIFLIDKDVLDISKSVEELIFKEHKPTISRNRNMKSHIEAYIKFFKLSQGNNAIDFTILEDLYDRWTYKTKKKRVSAAILSKLLQMYLPHKKYNNKRYFHLNNDIFKVVSKRQLDNIKKDNEEKKEDN